MAIQFDFKKLETADGIVDRRIPLGDDRILSFTIYEQDDLAQDQETQEVTSGVVRDITGYSLIFIVRTTDTTPTAELITKTTGGGGITISGTYDADPGTNTQKVEVDIEDTDTWVDSSDFLKPGKYRYAMKRTDDGTETTLVYGDFIIFETTTRD